MTVESTMNIEAALYNEKMLSWELLIEPTLNAENNRLSPWCVTCSIKPVRILIT